MSAATAARPDQKGRIPVQSTQALKQQAASTALTYVRGGMVLGLGSGTTTVHFIRLLASRLKTGALLDVMGVATSETTAALARTLGIPLTSLTRHPQLDLAVDGADEVDPDLNLIKGLGRALLREKIVAIHAQRFVVVVDESKLVSRLGEKSPLPVEVVQFEAETHLRWLKGLGCQAQFMLEDDGSRVLTDNGNNLVLCRFAGGINDPHQLGRTLADRPGIVEHGLFLNLATDVVVAAPTGIRVLIKEGAN
jgi:ribose 5-phosphate isomerase A